MSKNILVVIDAQNDFIDGALANTVAQERVPNIVELINSKEWDYIFATYDTHFEDYLETKEGEKLPVKHCLYQSEGWKINDDVYQAIVNAEINGTKVTTIAKETFGYPDFGHDMMDVMGIETEEDLQEMNITMCGFCTDICVVSNALILKACFYKEAEINVVENACAGVTKESHDAAINTMKMCQINII